MNINDTSDTRFIILIINGEEVKMHQLENNATCILINILYTLCVIKARKNK